MFGATLLTRQFRQNTVVGLWRCSDVKILLSSSVLQAFVITVSAQSRTHPTFLSLSLQTTLTNATLSFSQKWETLLIFSAQLEANFLVKVLQLTNIGLSPFVGYWSLLIQLRKIVFTLFLKWFTCCKLLKLFNWKSDNLFFYQPNESFSRLRLITTYEYCSFHLEWNIKLLYFAVS